MAIPGAAEAARANRDFMISSVRAMAASDLPSRRTEAASASMSCTAPPRQTPITSQSRPGM